MFGDFERRWFNTVERQFYAPGGKGVNVARVVRRLGCRCSLLMLGGGRVGEHILALLAADGISPVVVPSFIETRTSVVLVDGRGDQILRTAGRSERDCSMEVLASADSMLTDASILCLSGSIPIGIPSRLYGQLVELADRRGVPTIVDAAGSALAAALESHPFLVVPNADETADLVGIRSSSDEEALRAVDALRSMGATNAVVTLGSRGLVARIENEEYFVTPPPGPILCATGAGDALVAGLATGFAAGRPTDAVLHSSVAVARSACMQSTSGVVGNRSEIHNISEQVHVARLPRGTWWK